MHATVFYRTSNRHSADGLGRVVPLDVEVAPGASPREIVTAAQHAHGVTLLTRTGVDAPFEIQTDEGIWSHPGQDRSVLVKGVRFQTWDELDAEPA